MDWGRWKFTILGWAGLAIALWALLYGLYWHDRTNHQIFWGDALIMWVGDVVMLEWVDTTLAAGFLAVLGGSFAFLAVLWLRQREVEDRQQSNHQLEIQALVTLWMSMEKTATIAMASTDIEYLTRSIDDLERHLSAAAFTGLPFAHIQGLISAARTQAIAAHDKVDLQRAENARMNMYALFQGCAQYLAPKLVPFFKDHKFPRDPVKVGPEIWARMSAMNLKRASFVKTLFEND